MCGRLPHWSKAPSAPASELCSHSSHLLRPSVCTLGCPSLRLVKSVTFNVWACAILCVRACVHVKRAGRERRKIPDRLGHQGSLKEHNHASRIRGKNINRVISQFAARETTGTTATVQASSTRAEGIMGFCVKNPGCDKTHRDTLGLNISISTQST